MTLRRRAQIGLVVALGIAVLALAALAGVLLGRVGGAGAAGADAAQIAGQLRAAEWTLWLGAATVLALALALGLATLQVGLLGPIEGVARQLALDPALPPLTATEEFARIGEALGHYRRLLDRDRADLAVHLGAAGAMRDAASQAQEHLEQSDRLALVGRVALGVAHEVGGPLAIVQGYLERLRAIEQGVDVASGGGPASEDAGREARLRCIDQAGAAADRIRTILADLSEPGRPRTRDADRPCDLAAVALRVVQQVENHPRAKALQVQLEAATATHPCDASASHVEQVALNLVLNAADATRGVGKVTLRLAQDGDWQVLHVDDDGPGLAAGDRDQVFEPFYTTKDKAGWGLGLAVSRRIAAGYGGTLEAGDSPLGGARFTLRLPVPVSQRRASRRI